MLLLQAGGSWGWWKWRVSLYSLKLQHYWNPTIKLFSVISRTLVGGGSYPTAGMQSVRSKVPGHWASVVVSVCLEEARQQLHKNVASNIEHVLAATPHKALTIRPLTSHHENYQRRTRHAGHCWRSRDELIKDVLLWTPTYGRAKAGRPARTCIQQLCEDTRCSPEDLPEAMNDREKWRERVRDIRVCGTTW